MTRVIPILLFALMVSGSFGLPPGGTVKLDESQQGKLNIRTDLKNIMVIILKNKNSDTHNSKSNPKNSLKTTLKGLLLKHLANKIEQEEQQETQNFIESKTAPYHVDLTKVKDKIQLQDIEKSPLLIEEKNIQESPNKTEEKGTRNEIEEKDNKEPHRFARAYVVSVPNEIDMEGFKDTLDGWTSKIKEKLLLLGATLEECGPDRRRDENGICRFIKVE